MGEVYLAEDSKLGREIALKILPADLAASPERLKRFQREARTLAAVDHPNIVHIYSVEQAAGVHFLTMQLIRGEELSERIPADGMSLREFFDVAVPLADALSSAHEKGITHRDLKPSNVMIDEEGRAKILDFGLAKSGLIKSGAEASQFPTEALTQEGVVLGTVPYMSPEQAEGKPVDHRSDIFSLGAIFYQMVTGRAPFRGDTALSVLSAILREEPPSITELKADIPHHLGRIVRKCLQKDPSRRYQSARELHNDLLDLRREVETGMVEPVGLGATPSVRQGPRALAALGLVGAVTLLVLIWRLAPDSTSTDLQTPMRWRSSRLTSLAGLQSEPSLSPDGQRFLFVDYSSSPADIYEQRVGGTRPNNLTEASGAADYQPVYSPDGQRIAFRSERDGGGLYVMEATGENVRRFVGEGFMPSWSPGSDRVVYSTVGFSLPWQGGHSGQDLRIADPETGAIETLDQIGFQPSWSPGGGRIAFMGLPIEGQRDIGTIPVEGGDPLWVTKDPALDWSPQWAPDGHFLYFASNRGGAHNIWRVAIDQETGEVLGDLQDVTSGGTELQGFLSIAADGLSIAYAGRQNISNLMAVPYDRKTASVTGPPVAITTGPRSLGLFDISPDGEWIAFMRTSPWEDIVLMRADGSEAHKLTDDPHNDRRPRFSPDGEQIYFYSNSDGALRVWSIRPDGTGRTLITDTDGGFMFIDPSPDGKTLSANTSEGGELFSLTAPYSKQTTWRFPRDSQNRMFAPVDWSSDGRRILGSLFTPGASDAITAIYDLDSEAYEIAPLRMALGAFIGDDHHIVWADGSKLMLRDLRAGETRELLSAAPDGARGPMLSPDGETLYFLQQSASSDIHLLVAEDPM